MVKKKNFLRYNLNVECWFMHKIAILIYKKLLMKMKTKT